MKRLTYRLEDQYGNPTDSIILESDLIFLNSSEKWKKVLLRLAAYEDTGLEPCDYSAIGHALEKADRAQSDLTEMIRLVGGIGLDRLRELAQADREGRCVVLPCKKGDTVWRIVHDATPHVTKDRCTDIKYENGDIWVHLIGDRVMGGWNFGKLLFLTRAEAEDALRREQNENL